MRTRLNADQSAAMSISRESQRSLPLVFAVALGLAILLPFVNFFRVRPFGDFYSEWACAVAFAIAGFVIGVRLPKKSLANLHAFAIPALIVATAALQAALGKYSYAADWQFWLAYLFIAALALLMGQALSEPRFRGHFGARIAWAIILAGTANFLLQVLQAARVSGDLSPFVVSSGSVCQLFGNVGQANHANSLAWLGIGSTSGRCFVALAASAELGVYGLAHGLAVPRLHHFFTRDSPRLARLGRTVTGTSCHGAGSWLGRGQLGLRARPP